MFFLHLVTKKLILDDWVDVNSSANKEWISVAIDHVREKNQNKTAFRLQNNEVEFTDMWAAVEQYLM